MEIYKLQQLSVTVCFIIASLCCCIAFDIVKAIRHIFPVKGVLEAVIDISFWIVCSIITYVCLYFSNSADIRWFELLGAIIGISLYISFIGKYSYIIILKCVKILFKIFSVIINLLRIPVKFLHILIMPLKNFIIKLKATVYFVFHLGYQKTVSSVKTVLTKIKRN